MYPFQFYVFCFVTMCVKIATNQFIFDLNQTPCEFRTADNQLGVQFNGDALYNFTAFGKRFLISPCKEIPEKLQKVSGCRNSSRACIKSEGQGSGVIEAGNQFELTEDIEEKLILSSLNGQECSAGEKYSIHLHLDCSDGVLSTPQEMWSTQCSHHIKIPTPNCERVRCAKPVNGNFISFESYRNKELQFHIDNKTFYVSLCGPAKSCRDRKLSGCEVTPEGNMISIGDVITQRVVYSDIDKKLSIRMSFGKKQNKIFTQIDMKCNWFDDLTNGAVKQHLHTKRIFELESKAACIKTPMKCVIRKDNLLYNISGLYKPNNWLVQNNKSISVNICGRLKTNNKKCSETHAQICYSTNRETLNYGSILSTFEANSDYVITARFTDGDVCPKNKSFKLSTDIKFECANSEFKPFLQEVRDCSIKILWKTPYACPNQVLQGDNCYIVDSTGHRNLSTMYAKTDQKHPISRNVYLRYNFCGILKTPCNSFVNASACLVANNKEFVLGNINKKVNSFNGQLSMDLVGDYCGDSSKNMSLRIDFFCNYNALNEGSETNVAVIQDMCSYVLNVSAPSACGSNKIVPCNVRDENFAYDLTPLMLSNKNYVVKDRKNSVEYILNVCRPVVTLPTSLCRMNQASCIRKLLEPNPVERFISGGVPVKGPELVDHELQIRYTAGMFCKEEVKDMETVIKFKCGSTVGEPVLIEDGICTKIFRWDTKYACNTIPVTQHLVSDCIVRDGDTEARYNLGVVPERNVRIASKDNAESMNFDVCSTVYYEQVANETIKKESKLKIVEETNGLNLIYKLNNTCTERQYPNELFVEVICGNNNALQYIDTKECTIFVRLYTPEACNIYKSYLSNIHEKTEVPISSLEIKPAPEDDQSNLSLSAIVGATTGGLFISIFIFIIIYMTWKRKYCNNECYKRITANKENTQIYVRDTLL